MILKGNERGHGAELALHLLNPRDNDHVTLHALDGFVAGDLAGALAEAEAISGATQCRNYLFSMSLNPPPEAQVSVEEFETAIARVEAKLGLTGQPRAIVFHEKNGRRHAHCVWSRIDAAKMRAINIAHSKRKLMDIAEALYRERGWDMPAGFTDPDKRDPLGFTREEAGQAKRAARDPKALKAMFKECWEQSDSRAAFAAALWTEGYCLARGDRRGFVAVDRDGKPWSLSRWCGVTPKDLAARLDDPTDLPNVEEAQRLIEAALDRGPSAAAAVIMPDPGFAARRQQLVERQRTERDALLAAQETRRAVEQRDRAARLPQGLSALWARLTGAQARIVAELEREAKAAEWRDREERQALIDRHLGERRALQRSRAASELARDLDAAFAAATRRDPRQQLILRPDALPFTTAQLIREPTLILQHLSHRQATFSDLQVKRALAEQIGDPLTLRQAIDTALASSVLVRLDDGSLTTRDYQTAAAQLDADAVALRAGRGFAVSATHVDAAMSRQDAMLHDRFGGSLSAEQRDAVVHITDDRQFDCVVGLAGSGKSTMLATAHQAWSRQGIRVHGAAPSGKAAEGLQAASGIASRTLASLETSWKNRYAPIARGDVLVIDEAGMIGMRQLARIAAKLRDIGAKLVLVGDPDQLQPIEAGTPFRHLVEQHSAAQLREIHRQREAWQRQASRDLAEGRMTEAFKAYDADGSVHRRRERDAALAALVEDYLTDCEAHGPDTSRLAFAHRRRDVFALNQAIRAALRSATPPSPETIIATDTGPRAFAAGDRVAFTRNDRDLGVRNGLLGTVAAITDGEISVRLDAEDGNARHVTVDPDRYASFDHGYAVTIHKSQGATVDRAWVLASQRMDASLTYVAMTRHREALRVYVSDDDRPTWMAETDDRLTRRRDRPGRSGPAMS